MDNTEFYRLLFGKCKDCSVTLMTLPGKQIEHYPAGEAEKVAEDAAKLGASTNTYISVWPRRKDIPPDVRGVSEDTQYATCLFADFDVTGPAHKEPNLPPTKEAGNKEELLCAN